MNAVVDQSVFQHYVAPPEFHVLERDERRLVIDPVNHKWFVTDKIGECLIRCLSERQSQSDSKAKVEQIIGSSIPDDEFHAYCRALFEQLHALNFLHQGEYVRQIPAYEPVPFPEVMYLHLTASCNLACSYCYNQEHRFNFLNDRKADTVKHGGNPDKLSFQTKKFLALIDEAADNGLQEIKLTGGEATLYKDFLILAKHAKSRGLFVNLMSNGALISEANAAEIVGAVTAVSISIDSASADGGHDKIRGEGSHQKALDAVVALKNAGLQNLHLNGVITPTTLNNVSELLDFAYDVLGAREVTLAGSALSVNDPTQRWGAKEHMLTGDEYQTMQETEYEYYREQIIDKPVEYRRQCGVGNGVVSVDPNGDIYPCQTLHEPEFKMGNAFKSGLAGALETAPNRDQARYATVDQIEECNVCPVRYVCSSGCRSEAYTREGDFLARNKDLCPTFYKIAVDRPWESAA
jgi:radical SAM protein with 4Fe4S-binding SPASM domain